MNYLFLDQDGFRTIFPYLKDIDASFLAPLLQDVQITNVKPLLGTDWYNELILQSSTNTLTTYNKTILDDYLCRLMAYFTYVNLIIEVHYDFTNKGVRAATSVNSDYVNDEMVEEKRKFWQDKANNLQSEMLNYICTYPERYPLYGTYGIDKQPTLPLLKKSKIYGI